MEVSLNLFTILDSNLAEYYLPMVTSGKLPMIQCDKRRSCFLQEVLVDIGDFPMKQVISEATDPMQRTHTYLYDRYGRLFQDIVEDEKRNDIYDSNT